MSLPDEMPLDPSPPSRRPTLRRTLAGGAAVLALCLGAVACSNDDDGADVRSSGPGACEAASASAASGSEVSGGEASASGSEACPSASASGSEAAAGACEVIDGTSGVESAAATSTVTLDEFSIVLDPSELAAGSVGFTTENAGEEPHELVIAQTTPDQIEVVDGVPDEAALGDAVIGEIEAFAAGTTCEGTFELTAGDYVAFCALVEEEADGTLESHYEEGMVTTFTVS